MVLVDCVWLVVDDLVVVDVVCEVVLDLCDVWYVLGLLFGCDDSGDLSVDDFWFDFVVVVVMCVFDL